MWNTPKAARLAKLPTLGSTENAPKDIVIHLHFFIGGCDWYIAEFDGDDTFYGFAIINNDLQNAEWGYISFSELRSLRIGFLQVDCEHAKHFKPRKVSEINALKDHAVMQ